MKNTARLARDSMLIWMKGEKSGRFVGSPLFMQMQDTKF